MKILLTLALLLAGIAPAFADDTRSEEFRNRGALQDLSTTKFTAHVAATPCKCVKYDYDDGVAVDRAAGFELPGLCTMNSRYVACHHNGGKYAGQSEICPTSCVSTKKVPEVTQGDEAKGRERAMNQLKAQYRVQVPANVLNSLGRQIPDWEPLVVRKLVDDYDRQLDFEGPLWVYAQAPMRRAGTAFQGGLVFFSKTIARKNVPYWAFFDANSGELLFNSPTPFLFDTRGSIAKVSIFPSGLPGEAPRSSFVSGSRSSISETVACCGVYSLDDMSKGPVLLSDEDAKKNLKSYSGAKSSVDELLMLHDSDVFYGSRLNPTKKVSLSAPVSMHLMPVSFSSVVTTLQKGAVIEIYSQGGEKNEWFGVVDGRQQIKGYISAKELKLK